VYFAERNCGYGTPGYGEGCIAKRSQLAGDPQALAPKAKRMITPGQRRFALLRRGIVITPIRDLSGR
jgi:hypothetical protein